MQLSPSGISPTVGAFASGVMAISFGDALYAWNNTQISILFCLSGIFWTAFTVQQKICVGPHLMIVCFPSKCSGPGKWSFCSSSLWHQ